MFLMRGSNANCEPALIKFKIFIFLGMLDEEEEDKPETLDEIKKKMKDLFSKLDTLTHYHYTPQAIHADVKVIRNLPTISMEEVAPVAMSGATLLAPQEIADKKKGKLKFKDKISRKSNPLLQCFSRKKD